MAVKVMIPTALRQFADNKDTIEVEGKETIGDVMTAVVNEHSDLKNHLYDEKGNLRSFVNVYVNNEDIRYLDKNDTKVGTDDTVMIVPSIAGGRS